jgi:uncharacterized NAD(P)/FAD-binding protein YdhS
LTAIDVALTLNQQQRTAPLVAISRRGLLPQPHLRQSAPASRCSPEIMSLLDEPDRLTARRLLRQIRCWAASESAQGISWQQVIDGLRPIPSLIWTQLSPAERKRFLRHVRPFWETHRHRIAPSIAETIDALKRKNLFEIAAGTVCSAIADKDGVNTSLAMRDGSRRTLRFAWVVNCTGPGAHTPNETYPFLGPLLQQRALCCDDLGLGLLTDDEGHALDAAGAIHQNLLVPGTLRKATLWESTAVPELRDQAQSTARMALDSLFARRAAGVFHGQIAEVSHSA